MPRNRSIDSGSFGILFHAKKFAIFRVFLPHPLSLLGLGNSFAQNGDFNTK
jgi:hypothetical protein